MRSRVLSLHVEVSSAHESHDQRDSVSVRGGRSTGVCAECAHVKEGLEGAHEPPHTPFLPFVGGFKTNSAEFWPSRQSLTSNH